MKCATLQPMKSTELDGKVALITGASNGIGAAVARRVASLGARVVAADIDDEAGAAVANEVDGVFVHCDVRDLAQCEAMVAAAVETFGGLDLVHLNAGVTSGHGVGEDFDLDSYHRAMSINFDGVVFGIHAALSVLQPHSGATIVATASMAGLTPVAFDPIYAANKAAVVSLVRSLAEGHRGDGININALCPSFAETSIIAGIRDYLNEVHFPILDVDDVVDTFLAILDGEGTGECWFVVPGRQSEPFGFRGVPGPKTS